ncbi:MAG: YhgE/Pip family protein [Methanobrevibacter sp.]|jgi:YhgE/Pip-like protein|nr:YhgE/Pip family protein [Candidatus Methanovirga meridionalis]
MKFLSDCFNIFRDDLGVIVRNPVVLIVLMGLIAIPSVYAIVNIYANMNPYDNVNHLSVAVVNLDNGSMGAQVCDGLRANGGFNWSFVDYDVGHAGLASGDYYGLIVIPKDFSSNINSIKDGYNVNQANIIFINNNKVNPISPRIVDSGVNGLEGRVNGMVSGVVANVVAGKLHDAGNVAVNNYNNYLRVKSRINIVNNVVNNFSLICNEYNVSSYLPADVVNKYNYNVGLLNKDTNFINNFDYNGLTSLNNVDAGNVSSFMSSPVVLTKESLYPVISYGDSVAPFYICLSLWIGCVVCLAMIKGRDNIGEGVSAFSVYLGRFLLFIILSVCQSCVMGVGCLFIGLSFCGSMLFFGTIILVGLCLMGIVYALVSSFGNVGKALSIVLLVFQIPSAGGVYPVELMPKFFGVLSDYLPLTYAICAFREVVVGFNYDIFCFNLSVLIAMSVSMFIVGLFIRGVFNKHLMSFQDKLHGSGLF